MRSTVELVKLSRSLDFKMAGRELCAYWKGVLRGVLATEKSDRTYVVAYPADFARDSRTCDTLGEACLWLVPELRQVEIVKF